MRTNECCGETATFSPGHRLTLYVVIVAALVGYMVSRLKKEIISPIGEVVLNLFLIIGFVLNGLITCHVEIYFWLVANLPIAILLSYQLIDNNKSVVDHFEQNSYEPTNIFQRVSWQILKMNVFIKFPILLVLCLPILMLISSMLLIFGQKPDSIIRAFTDTYKHGFSQLDHLCDNVQCGGHFLCSVAANGHSDIVKPIRYGERNGNKIICNRQLLISNAFEEIVEQKLPKLHKTIRNRYNKVGNVIHKHYHLFDNKFISDLIYFAMKPLELFFLIVIYTIDIKPENRIARQYLGIKCK
jgi:hypothetical protein